MAKYYVADAFSLEAGPQLGFLMSAKADGKDNKKEFNSTDFAFNLGAGYDLNEQMSLGLRYNIGLSDIEKDLMAGESGSTNSSLQLSFGYKF
jgi:outer membrane autotransporter protein